MFDNDRHGGTHVASPRTGTLHSTRAVPRRSWRAHFTQPELQCFYTFHAFDSHHRCGPSSVSFPVSVRQCHLETILGCISTLGMIHGDIFTNIFTEATVRHFFRRAFPSCIPQQPSLTAFLHLSSLRPTARTRGAATTNLSFPPTIPRACVTACDTAQLH